MITKYHKPTFYAIAHWFKLFLYFESYQIYKLPYIERLLWIMRAFAPLILWTEDIGHDVFNYWLMWELTMRDFPKLATREIPVWGHVPNVIKDFLLVLYIVRIEKRGRLYVDLWYLTNPGLLQMRPMMYVRVSSYRSIANSMDEYLFRVLQFLTYPFFYMREESELLDYLFVYEWFGEEVFNDLISRGVLMWVRTK